MDGLIIDDQFLTLLNSHQRRLVGYLRALVPNRADAEEVLQEVNLYLSQNAGSFELGTDFAAWALKVAHFRVLKWRRRQSRDRLVFDDSLLERLAVTAESLDTCSARRQGALEECLGQLAPNERDLIRQFYGELGATPQSLASSMGRTVQGVYVTAHRIRVRLFECIQRKLAAEDR